MHTFTLKVRLAALSFIEFAVWGAYLTSLGNFLAGHGLASEIGWFYAVQGIVSLFMPTLMGIIADRWIPAQRMLALSHLLAGLFMGAAGAYCLGAEEIEFLPLFTLYTLSVAFFMPTIGLCNSVSFNALTRAGLDTVTAFPPIRVFGTVGFICAMLFVNYVGPEGAHFQSTAMQLIVSAILSLAMALYSLTMPHCPVTCAAKGCSLYESLGLKAFSLFKQRKMALFFCFSMLLGVALQITNGYANPFITSFKDLPQYASDWAAQNANALISLSQISETLCILLIPFCLKRFGIKGVMLMSMIAWVGRFGFFGAGDPSLSGGLWMFAVSCIVYGVAFDFFNVSGGLYVDKMTTPEIRSSAQGLFMIMTNGLGASIGTICAMQVVNHFVYQAATPEAQMEGWRICWYIFAGYAALVAILFALFFHDSHDNASGAEVREAEAAALSEV
ncbi:MAG: MFS transporter [Pseudoflavonifractor sp.]|nr:MFS transporter [Alloprevotella sp.]MCM1116501.1 MFS transporter [Pseudoflavonifractor sp.]